MASDFARVEQAYHRLGEQTDPEHFVRALLEEVIAIFDLDAASFADAAGGVSWRMERNGEYRQFGPLNIRHDNWLTVGRGTDLNAPCVDGNKVYLLSKLARGDQRFGWLYAYGFREMAVPTHFESIINYVSIIVQNIQLIDSMHRAAQTDALTELPNRRALEAHLRDRIMRGTPFQYVMMDLNDFKKINDTHGHDAGDEALKVFASEMRNCARKMDVVARLAGDEFVALLDGRDGSTIFQERLGRNLRRHGLSASFGQATYPDEAKDSASLSKVADGRMYEYKQQLKSRRAAAAN